MIEIQAYKMDGLGNDFIIIDRRKDKIDFSKQQIIDGSRKKRIANGSGTDIALVNKLLKQHKMMTGMMKRMSQGGGRNFGGLGEIPPELFNKLK